MKTIRSKWWSLWLLLSICAFRQSSNGHVHFILFCWSIIDDVVYDYAHYHRIRFACQPNVAGQTHVRHQNYARKTTWQRPERMSKMCCWLKWTAEEMSSNARVDEYARKRERDREGRSSELFIRQTTQTDSRLANGIRNMANSDTAIRLIFNGIRDAVDLSQNCEKSINATSARQRCVLFRGAPFRLTLMKCPIFLVHFCFVNLTKFLIFQQAPNRWRRRIEILSSQQLHTVTAIRNR